jgi:hypothetical protein
MYLFIMPSFLKVTAKLFEKTRKNVIHFSKQPAMILNWRLTIGRKGPYNPATFQLC